MLKPALQLLFHTKVYFGSKALNLEPKRGNYTKPAHYGIQIVLKYDLLSKHI